jgi:hypothetical protein
VTRDVPLLKTATLNIRCEKLLIISKRYLSNSLFCFHARSNPYPENSFALRSGFSR